MKAEAETPKVQTRYRRYSEHPLIQKKVAKANEILAKTDLSFLDVPATDKQDK